MINKNTFAPTAPMGWNSWDCYGAAVTEEVLLKNTDYMAEHKSLDYAMDRAKQEAQKAVDAIALLPKSEYKKALISLAYLSVDRTY